MNKNNHCSICMIKSREPLNCAGHSLTPPKYTHKCMCVIFHLTCDKNNTEYHRKSMVSGVLFPKLYSQKNKQKVQSFFNIWFLECNAAAAFVKCHVLQVIIKYVYWKEHSGILWQANLYQHLSAMHNQPPPQQIFFMTNAPPPTPTPPLTPWLRPWCIMNMYSSVIIWYFCTAPTLAAHHMTLKYN